MTSADTALLEELRDMWMTYDPPPADLVATMIAVVAAADLDDEWETLVLMSDSADGPAAQVRGLGTSRILYVTAAECWSLDAELDEGQVRGQMLDFQGDLGGVEVVVETTDGQTWTTGLDEVGFFAITAEPTGSIRFTVRHGRHKRHGASSRWVEL